MRRALEDPAYQAVSGWRTTTPGRVEEARRLTGGRGGPCVAEKAAEDPRIAGSEVAQMKRTRTTNEP